VYMTHHAYASVSVCNPWSIHSSAHPSVYTSTHPPTHPSIHPPIHHSNTIILY
jgi:hypothetical protein